MSRPPSARAAADVAGFLRPRQRRNGRGIPDRWEVVAGLLCPHSGTRLVR